MKRILLSSLLGCILIGQVCAGDLVPAAGSEGKKVKTWSKTQLEEKDFNRPLLASWPKASPVKPNENNNKIINGGAASSSGPSGNSGGRSADACGMVYDAMNPIPQPCTQLQASKRGLALSAKAIGCGVASFVGGILCAESVRQMQRKHGSPLMPIEDVEIIPKTFGPCGFLFPFYQEANRILVAQKVSSRDEGLVKNEIQARLDQAADDINNDAPTRSVILSMNEDRAAYGQTRWATLGWAAVWTGLIFAAVKATVHYACNRA